MVFCRIDKVKPAFLADKTTNFHDSSLTQMDSHGYPKKYGETAEPPENPMVYLAAHPKDPK